MPASNDLGDTSIVETGSDAGSDGRLRGPYKQSLAKSNWSQAVRCDPSASVEGLSSYTPWHGRYAAAS